MHNTLKPDIYSVLEKTSIVRPDSLSRLYVDQSKNLWLLDYNCVEIAMSPLIKALYLLFLRHPEGISFYALEEHKAAFIQLYESISKSRDKRRLLKNSHRLLNRQNNSIHEKCSRVKEAFTNVLPEHLAQYYYIKGARRERKKISLDPQFILWA